jgi:outer membrane protein assembly factor BamB
LSGLTTACKQLFVVDLAPVTALGTQAVQLYIGGAGHAFALCRNSGEVLWETELNPRFFKTGSDFVSFSLMETKKGLFAFSYATLYRIDPKSGEIIWQRKIDKLGHKVGVLATDLLESLSAEIGEDGTGDGGDGGGD